MKRSTVKELLGSTDINNDVLLKGWVRTRRGNNQVAFIAVNDGTIIHNIQVVAELNSFPEELMKRVTTGSSISVTGKLVESMGKGQSIEIHAREISILGDADPDVYPLQNKSLLIIADALFMSANKFNASSELKLGLFPVTPSPLIGEPL